MDDARNPFDPQHAAPLRALAGRAREIAAIDDLVTRLAAGAPAAPLVFAGRSGVGTSSVLGAVAERADAHDWYTGASAATVADPLRDAVARAFARALVAFAARRPGAVAVRTAGDAVAAFAPFVAAELPVPPDPRSFDEARGDFARDVGRLLARVGDGLRELVGRGLCIVIDDLHHADPAESVALLRTFATSTRDGQPIALVVGGTPTTRWLAGSAGVADGIVDIVPLDAAEVSALLRTATARAGAGIDDAAIASIASATAGYPALMARYAAAAWRVADGPIITAADVLAGAATARDDLATSELAAAFAVGAPARRYVRAVAEADDPADSAAIARQLGDTTRFGGASSQLTELRDELVRAGVLSNLDGTHITFAHPAARSYVLSWE